MCVCVCVCCSSPVSLLSSNSSAGHPHVDHSIHRLAKGDCRGWEGESHSKNWQLGFCFGSNSFCLWDQTVLFHSVKQQNRTNSTVVYSSLRVQPPLRSSTPETHAGLRDSSLLPRPWDGEPQRWCKSYRTISLCHDRHFIYTLLANWLWFLLETAGIAGTNTSVATTKSTQGGKSSRTWIIKQDESF